MMSSAAKADGNEKHTDLPGNFFTEFIRKTLIEPGLRPGFF
jgi:hypothetical protein